MFADTARVTNVRIIIIIIIIIIIRNVTDKVGNQKTHAAFK